MGNRRPSPEPVSLYPDEGDEMNKVILIGRLTRDPESRTFANGGKVCNVGLAVNDRKKNAQTGQWEDDPTFVDLKAFNSQYRKLADQAERLTKGRKVAIEGRLKLEQWQDAQGAKRQKMVVYLDYIEYLDPKPADGGGGQPQGGGQQPRQQTRQTAPADPPDDYGGDANGGYTDFKDDDIPF